MSDQKTKTVTKSLPVSIPTVAERKLETFHVIVTTIGEVQDTRAAKGEAETRLRELAEGRSCGEYPRLFLIEAKAVPTDEALAEAKASE